MMFVKIGWSGAIAKDTDAITMIYCRGAEAGECFVL